MMDKTTGKNFVYSGDIVGSSETGKDYSPYYEALDRYDVQIPPGTDVYKQGVEIPVLRPLPKVHLPSA